MKALATEDWKALQEEADMDVRRPVASGGGPVERRWPAWRALTVPEARAA